MGGYEGQVRRDPLPVLSAGVPCEQFWHGQGCPLLYVVHPAFLLVTTVSPTLQGALKDDLERLSWHMTCLYHASFHLLIAFLCGTIL